MKRVSTVGLAVFLLAVLGGAAQATIIDFEAFTNLQNIHGVNLGGVTLYDPQLGSVQVFADRSDAFYHSPVNVVVVGGTGTYPMIGVFDDPQSYIALWAGDAGTDDDQWELEAFDAVAGGNSLGLVQSSVWDGNPYTQLSISAAGIWRFEARFIGNAAGVAYDDLEFSGSVIPAPGAILLGTLGTGLVGWLRRRKSL